jgi:hypothetical protein
MNHVSHVVLITDHNPKEVICTFRINRFVFNEEVYGLCLYMMAIYLTVVWVAICAIVAYLYKREFESRKDSI